MRIGSVEKRCAKRQIIFFFLLNIKNEQKTLNINNVRLDKKEFCKSKEPIDLMSVNSDQIVISCKFKHNNEDFKYFIGDQEGGIVKLLCIILPQMCGYLKCVENGGKKHVLFY